MDSNKKKCPYCGEEIMADAKKCRHCGEWLDKSSKNEHAPNTQAVVQSKSSKTLIFVIIATIVGAVVGVGTTLCVYPHVEKQEVKETKEAVPVSDSDKDKSKYYYKPLSDYLMEVAKTKGYSYYNEVTGTLYGGGDANDLTLDRNVLLAIKKSWNKWQNNQMIIDKRKAEIRGDGRNSFYSKEEAEECIKVCQEEVDSLQKEIEEIKRKIDSYIPKKVQ